MGITGNRNFECRRRRPAEDWCSFDHRVGIRIDEDERPEGARLRGRFRYIGIGAIRAVTR